jgi:hypothetical protein
LNKHDGCKKRDIRPAAKKSRERKAALPNQLANRRKKSKKLRDLPPKMENEKKVNALMEFIAH